MDIKSKVFKRKTGKSKGKWIVRIAFYDVSTGKQRFMERHADKRSEAVDLKAKLVGDLKKSHGQIQTGERMTFTDLVKICKNAFYRPAVIVEGKKVAGVRSHKSLEYQLNTLSAFFGNRLLNNITQESLVDFKLHRLNPKAKTQSRPVKIATVNRELSAMRKMMKFAYGKGWVLRDIFFDAKVIDSSAEVERKRLLTDEEETRLIAACQGEREITYVRNWKGKDREVTQKLDVDNPLLKAIIILALDSGMRKGEILKLRWEDINFEKSEIKILGTNTKTERERLAPLSERAKMALLEIREVSVGEKPFPFKDFKRAFATAKKIAGIKELQFRDLRRTAVTRWIVDDIPLTIAGKLAGHTKSQTTMKHYTAVDSAIVADATEKINAFNTARLKALEQTRKKGLGSELIH